MSISDAADLTVGTHIKTFAIGSGAGQVALPGTGTAESNVAYHLLAVADPADAVAEDDAHPTSEDNTAVITGVYRGSTGTLFIHGTVEADELSVVTDSNVTVILNGVTSVFAAADVSSIRARLHAGDDTATGKPTPKPTFIDGGDGVDTLLGPDIAGIWKISELNTGSRSTAKFWSFESITGGNLEDTFKFVQSGSLSGEIDGGEGTNTLDYESLHSSIVVDLSEGTASRTAGVENIQNVFTGCGDDDVTGDEQDNIIRTGRGDDKADGGAGGYDIFVAGAGDDHVTGGPQRSILIGGGGKDCLRGGDEEDLLIGNGTIHDNDIAALNALMAEWKRTDIGYDERIAHLTGETSEGANGDTLLTSCTVYGGATRDKLYGGGSLDWFWGTACEVQDRQTAEVRSKGHKPVLRLGPFVHSIGCHVHSIVTATVRKLRRASCL